MPVAHTVKQYVAGGFYHLYNRGIDQRLIFMDERDYAVFMHILKTLLLDPKKLENEQVRPVRKSDVYDEIKLVAFCLMPNHFHLMVQQLSDRAITRFTRRLNNAYVTYFNQRHERRGSLFEGKLKAILVEYEEYYLYLTRYIHRNPLAFWTKPLITYPYSSYPYYLGKKQADWVKPEDVLSYFQRAADLKRNPFTSYEGFMNDTKGNDEARLEELTLEIEHERRKLNRSDL
jgi:putative transposase